MTLQGKRNLFRLLFLLAWTILRMTPVQSNSVANIAATVVHTGHPLGKDADEDDVEEDKEASQDGLEDSEDGDLVLVDETDNEEGTSSDDDPNDENSADETNIVIDVSSPPPTFSPSVGRIEDLVPDSAEEEEEEDKVEATEAPTGSPVESNDEEEEEEEEEETQVGEDQQDDPVAVETRKPGVSAIPPFRVEVTSLYRPTSGDFLVFLRAATVAHLETIFRHVKKEIASPPFTYEFNRVELSVRAFTFGSSNRGRELQTDTSDESVAPPYTYISGVTFDGTAYFHDLPVRLQDDDVRQVLSNAFESEHGKGKYFVQLEESDSVVLQNVVGIEVKIYARPSNDETTTEKNPHDNSGNTDNAETHNEAGFDFTLYIFPLMLGIAAAIGTIILATVIACLFRRQKARHFSKTAQNQRSRAERRPHRDREVAVDEIEIKSTRSRSPSPPSAVSSMESSKFTYNPYSEMGYGSRISGGLSVAGSRISGMSVRTNNSGGRQQHPVDMTKHTVDAEAWRKAGERTTLDAAERHGISRTSTASASSSTSSSGTLLQKDECRSDHYGGEAVRLQEELLEEVVLSPSPTKSETTYGGVPDMSLMEGGNLSLTMDVANNVSVVDERMIPMTPMGGLSAYTTVAPEDGTAASLPSTLMDVDVTKLPVTTSPLDVEQYYVDTTQSSGGADATSPAELSYLSKEQTVRFDQDAVVNSSTMEALAVPSMSAGESSGHVSVPAMEKDRGNNDTHSSDGSDVINDLKTLSKQFEEHRLSCMEDRMV